MLAWIAALFTTQALAAEPAPRCELDPLNGLAVSEWSAFEGQMVYVDFWASWCLPCLRSFPFMMELMADERFSALQVVAVNLDEDIEAARDFLADHQLLDPAGSNNNRRILAVVDASRECARAFGVSAMPSSYLIDQQGVIRYQHRGFRPADEQLVREEILSLLAQ
jgi:thiol-disulfide isomerase/thioredoxin